LQHQGIKFLKNISTFYTELY